jgi:hypothetical protein
MNELTTFYTALLQSAGVTIDKETGGVFLPAGGTEVTVKIDGKEKPLVIPYADVLRKADWCNIIGFHPTCESSYAGQSQVLNTLLKLLSMAYYDKMQLLVGTIIALGADKSKHDSLPLPLLEYFANLGEITPSVNKLFAELVKKNTGISGAYPLFSLRLHRGGTIDEELFSRTCTIVPNVITSKLFGSTNHSIKARETLLKIYESVFPDKLVYGSNHSSMPYFMVLLSTYYHGIGKLNKLNHMLGKFSTIDETSLIWYKNIGQLSQWAKQIPQVLRGNVGDPIKPAGGDKRPDGVEVKPPEGNIPQQQQQSYIPPVQHPQNQQQPPVPVSPQGQLSMEERLKGLMQGHGAAGYYPPTPTAPSRGLSTPTQSTGWGQQSAGWGQPTSGWGQQQQPQQNTWGQQTAAWGQPSDPLRPPDIGQKYNR